MRTLTHSVYVVAWREALIVKAGYTSGKRWATFVNRGAELIDRLIFPDVYDAFAHEARLESILHDHGARAFAGRDESKPYVGHNGSGWCECYRVEDVDGALAALRSASVRIPRRSPYGGSPLWSPDLTRPDQT